MSQIAVRLSEGELRRLDAVVRDGGYRTRAEAVRAGIRLLGSGVREERIAASYARAYGAPLGEDETQMLDAAAALATELPAVIARGEVWDADLGPVVRPVLVVTRETAIPVLGRLVCAAITKTARGHPAEVELSRSHGVDQPSVVNCDWLVTLAKDRLVRCRGRLDPITIRRLNAALVIALGLDA